GAHLPIRTSPSPTSPGPILARFRSAPVRDPRQRRRACALPAFAPRRRAFRAHDRRRERNSRPTTIRRLNPNTRHKPTRAFVLHLIPEPGVDAIKAFRSLLKTALRRYGLRAVHVQECALPAQEDERALAPTMEDSMSAFSERIREQRKTGLFKVADLE